MKSGINILVLFILFTACRSEVKTEIQSKGKEISETQLLSVNKYLSDKDKDIIEHFIRRQGWAMKFAEDGYFYEIINPGIGSKIKDLQQVEYEFTIKLLNGTLCYSSEEIGSQKFVVGAAEEISGMHLAIQQLANGGRARFIFPSQLAHGLVGDMAKIPPRAILVYDIKVIKVE